MNLLIKQQLVEINTGHLSSISGRSRSSSSKSDDSNKASDEDTDYVEDKSPRTRGLKQKTKLVIKRIKSYAKENNIKIPYITKIISAHSLSSDGLISNAIIILD